MKINKLISNIRKLEKRNNNFLHLTAYENQLSKTANIFLSSKLSERYFFGPGTKGIIDWNPFTCLGLKDIQNLIDEANLSMKKMISCESFTPLCLSGVHAMMCTILSLSNPGDTVMIVAHKDGGHFATRHILERTGRKYVYAPFNLKSLDFDNKMVSDIFKEKKCKLLYLDISYCINPINIKALRKSLGKKAIIIYDASHTIGLMMGGQFQSPLIEGADIICANTHKTLPGPQKGLIAFKNKKLAKKVNNVISKGLVSSSHSHHLIALSISILEMKKYGKEYAKQIIKNSNQLGMSLESLGYEVRKTPDGLYSLNHQVHLYIDNFKDRKKIYSNLVKNNISTNFDDRLGDRLFIRLGTQEITRRGMKETDIKEIATLIDKSLRGKNVKNDVIKFNSRFKNIYYSFD